MAIGMGLQMVYPIAKQMEHYWETPMVDKRGFHGMGLQMVYPTAKQMEHYWETPMVEKRGYHWGLPRVSLTVSLMGHS